MSFEQAHGVVPASTIAEGSDRSSQLAVESEPFFELDPRAIYIAIRRNIVAIVAIVVGALVLGLVITLLTVPTYVANSRVLIEQQEESIIEDENAPVPTAQDAERFLRT